MSGEAAEADLELEVDAELARGRYANAVLVHGTRTELTLDFAFVQPDGRALLQARVVLAPDSARDLASLLAAQLAAAGDDRSR